MSSQFPKPEVRDSHGVGLLLREDADEEVGLVVGLEGGGDEQVLPRRQREALRHLAHVDVGPATSLRWVVPEEVLLHLTLIIRCLESHGIIIATKASFSTSFKIFFSVH